eukprot:TRINITY_DN701_c0_g1_i1.p2 TRINITY_DN701_c0_g1~~TRINITY_DN701_c0_g1_i1.p2  ORF type:complete len:159 (+),score=15.20 TRINITY_DN701_c0_g1_i1:62-478(+)
MAAIAFPNASSFHRNSLVCQSAVPAQGQWRRSDFNGRVLKMQRRRVSVRAESSDLNTNPKPKPSKKKSEASEGVFAPLVVLTRNIIGKKRFNQLRGKAIALHSQVITEFCKSIGADSKQRQGLIRLAKKNGEKLGFLA